MKMVNIKGFDKLMGLELYVPLNDSTFTPLWRVTNTLCEPMGYRIKLEHHNNILEIFILRTITPAGRIYISNQKDEESVKGNWYYVDELNTIVGMKTILYKIIQSIEEKLPNFELYDTIYGWKII
jgi:hypothetical protein